ncbi:hypothetical protein LI221_08295 [Faecalimonas umbilicata]|nr:hypothetical protein [Faecalimonas umbilicata]
MKKSISYHGFYFGGNSYYRAAVFAVFAYRNLHWYDENVKNLRAVNAEKNSLPFQMGISSIMAMILFGLYRM